MGIFTSSAGRPYVPPFDAPGDQSKPSGAPRNSTLLGDSGGDPNILQVSDGDSSATTGGAQIAQQQQNREDPAATSRIGVGQAVELPDGSTVPDRYSPSGLLMSPVAHLGNVAAAGRDTGNTYRVLRSDPATFEAGTMHCAARFGFNLGHGGAFDYQRGLGNSITGFERRPQFHNVSNVNVGLFGQQAGMSLDDVLRQAGAFARFRSSNASSSQPYGLDTQTREFIELGCKIGASNMFGAAATR